MEYLRDYVFPDTSINMPIEIFQHAIEYGSISRTQLDKTGRIVIDSTYCFNVPFGVTKKWQIVDNFPIITEISPYIYGKLHGVQKKWKNGKIESIEGFHNGTLHGPSTSYFDNGVIQQHAKYKYGVLQGEKKMYYVNGVVVCGIVLYNNNYFEKYSNYPNGTPKTVSTITDDRCETAVYNERFEIIKIVRTTKGVTHGVQESFEYFGDGSKLHTSTTHSMGIRHGPEIITSIVLNSPTVQTHDIVLRNGPVTATSIDNPNIGEIRIITSNYKDDELDGYYEKRRRNGKLEHTCYYKDGKLHGLSTHYDTNEQKYIEVNYDDGQMHGDRKQYKNNEIATIERYYYGKLDGYYENKNSVGDVISSYTLKKGVYHGEANIIYNGNRVKCVFKNGLIDGPCLTFSNRGVLLKRTHYKDGILDGPDEKYENDKIVDYVVYEMGTPVNKEFEDTSYKVHLMPEGAWNKGSLNEIPEDDPDF